MKKISLLSFLFALSFGVIKAEDTGLAKMSFEKTTIDLGQIKAGNRQTVDFCFTSESKTPLVISKVTTSCGCVASEYPKEPIKKGDKGCITLVLDVKGTGAEKSYLYKTGTVFANVEGEKQVLSVRAEVINKPEAEQAEETVAE